MKPFDFATLLVRHDSIPDYRESVNPEARDYHCLAAPGQELYPYAEIDSSVTEPQKMAQRMVACINACHGLDLPDDIPAGAVANLVAAARAVSESTGRLGHPVGMPALDAALAPFTGDAAPPVSPEPRQWGIFRKAVKTGLGDMPESLITWEPSKDAAEAQLIKLLRSSDVYYMRELRPDEYGELMAVHEEQIHKDALLAAFGDHGQG